MEKKEVTFTYAEFEAIIKDHIKDMKKQTKLNLGLPKKVTVYSNDKVNGFRYEY